MALERVLLAVTTADRDRLDRLVDATVDVASPADATVYLLYHFPEDDYEDQLARMGVDPTTSRLTPDELAARQESVREPAERFEAAGVDYEIRGVSGGDPAKQAVRRIRELAADVVVVGGTERSPTGKAVFGDHAQQVLLNAPCPVLYVKRD